MKKLLFVSGVPRSGTTALGSLLNAHPDIYLGVERYYTMFDNGRIAPEHFEEKRFLDIQAGDTHAKAQENGLIGKTPEAQKKLFDQATYVGDKVPRLYQRLPQLMNKFPDAKHIFILRNPISVIESYQKRFNDKNDRWGNDFRKGIVDWNTAIRIIKNLPEEFSSRLLVVEFEKIFFKEEALQQMFDFLELDMPPEETYSSILTKASELEGKLTPRYDRIRRAISLNINWEDYRDLTSKLLEKKSNDEPAASKPVDKPVTALSAKARAPGKAVKKGKLSPATSKN